MEKLLEIDNKKYILHDCVITTKNRNHYKTAFKKFNCIDGEVKQVVKDGWFSNGFMLCSVYIPITDTAENAIEQFQDFIEKKENNIPASLVIGISLISIIVVIMCFLMEHREKKQKPTTASRIKALFKSASLEVKSYFTKN